MKSTAVRQQGAVRGHPADPAELAVHHLADDREDQRGQDDRNHSNRQSSAGAYDVIAEISRGLYYKSFDVMLSVLLC